MGRHRKRPNRWFKSPFGHIEYTFAVDQDDLDQLLSEFLPGVSLQYMDSPDTKGIVTFFNREGLSTVAIVRIDPELHDGTYEGFAYIASIMAHESYHIHRRMCKMMGEKRPSEEFTAYCIQQFTLNLLNIRRELKGYYGSIKK